ncbi:hypothetical protein [Streptomyces avicenniae]|uniref:hypothetical protein n=1 Tax=Streptomyces avicenniae TaxID=500153 RepID=UPI00069B205D|nr:hypothetical protein [Streptomyces avicenniae]
MKRVRCADGSSLYAYTSPGPARILVCSTPSSRRLLTDPTICGAAYRQLSRTAVAEALRLLTDADVAGLTTTPADQFAALTVLRGGLSFGVEDAVGQVLGADPVVSFVGTERPSDGAVELTYDRWELAEATFLVVGDIIGTGGTLARTLTEAVERAARRGRPLRSLLVFTIGSRLGVQRLEAALADVDAASRPSLIVVVLESLYELPTPGTQAPFARFPFDLLRSPVTSAPEYEEARLRAVGSLFERCAVYDGGVRAFTPAEHGELRSGWWADVVDRKVRLGELAALTAGLETYRLPLEDWKRVIPWSSHVDEEGAAVIHGLGRAALSLSERLDTHDYLSHFLTGKGKLVGTA